MKVGELIFELQNLDPNMPVVVEDNESGSLHDGKLEVRTQRGADRKVAVMIEDMNNYSYRSPYKGFEFD